MIVRGDARRLPLADASVDLVVTSPPYWQLRAYATGHPAELARVLKPSGSIFVNLGDCYADRANRGPSAGRGSSDAALGRAARPRRRQRFAVARKSLYGLPWAYALGCTGMLAALGGPDPGLGLILRAELVWAKPNALPESVTDRVRRTHETWFHLVKSPRYYAAVEELRQPHAPGSAERAAAGYRDRRLRAGAGAGQRRPAELDGGYQVNPAGALPGSVWTIPSEPLRLPGWLTVEHYAAFPTEWPRRLILGWSPPGICCECGQGRLPVPVVAAVEDRRGRVQGRRGDSLGRAHGPDGRSGERYRGYACACTPHTDHPGTGASSGPDGRYGDYLTEGGYPNTAMRLGHAGLAARPRVGPWREHHLDGWTAPPTRPAVVLDPFCGTGTTVIVARALGRIGVGVDLSEPYCRLARWRVFHSGHAAKALARTWAGRQSTLTDQGVTDR